jgi:hypothetical protein
MGPITEEVVEKTWQEASLLGPEQAQKEMARLGKRQPDLLAFLMASVDDVPPDVQELAVYLTFVVYRMFEGSAKKLKKISSREFMACYEENINLLQSLEGTDDKFVERIIQIQASRQPHVVKYVVDALMEEERDAVLLSDDDRGLIFIILKTVIDALDKQSRK